MFEMIVGVSVPFVVLAVVLYGVIFARRAR